ncbi:hypothetical protein [Parvularcula maris]|uniref:Uncharacterized protein n=1 Tax=Parvularcula maris TaxID=2965077 RepID=A0A9X2L956_9PROT|nr:hypothetical protein [Parvularcula maris]MCQ8184552.1 hypothetical protein [Parvularcula maris]
MRKLNFETIGSISAIVVAVASLFVAWDEARSVRRQQAASVLPIVKIETPFRNDDEVRSFRIEVSNVGIGPAFIDRGRIAWNGEEVRTAEDLKFNVEDTAGKAEFWTAPIQGQVLGGGDTFLLYEVSWDPNAEGAQEAAFTTVQTLREAVEISACYCSVYDRCWRTGMNQLGRPERVGQCLGGE